MADPLPSPTHLFELASLLESLDMTVAPGGDDIRARAARLAGEYLAERLRHPDAPLVVAVVGLAGVGTSTIVNSLAGQRLSAVGSTHPTTVDPVVWAGAALPTTLDALRRRLPGRIVEARRPPPGGAVVIDTPPPGVTDGSGVPVIDQVLDVSDVCVIVASATRYADADGLRLVERAHERGMVKVLVVNRLPDDADAAGAIVDDYTAKLHALGLVGSARDAGLVGVIEAPGPPAPRLLPTGAVAGIRVRLEALGGAAVRRGALDAVVAGSLGIVDSSLTLLRRRLVEAAVRRLELSAPVDHAYSRELDDLLAHVRSGRFAGAACDEVVTAVAAATARHAGRGARAAAERWDSVAHDLAAAHPDLFTHAPATIGAAREAIDRWAGAADAASPGRSRRRRIPRRVREAWVRAAVDAAWTGRRGWRGRRLPGLAEASRHGLEQALRSVLDGDAARFHELLGSSPPPGALGALRLEDRS